MPCPPARPTACLPRRTPAKRSTSSKNCGERCASTESANCGAATPKPPVAIERVTPHGRPDAARGVQPGLRDLDGETPSCTGLCGGRTRSSYLYFFEIIFPFDVLLHVPHLYFRIMLKNQQPLLVERPIQNPPLRLQGLQGIQIVAHDVRERQVRHGRDE